MIIINYQMYGELRRQVRSDWEAVRGSKATSDGSPLATSRPIPVFETSAADETLSPEDIGITTADFDEMTFTVKRMAL